MKRSATREVRLIGDDGEQLGILPIQQAQDIAVEKGMDLVKSRRRLSRLSARSWITVNSASSRQSARRKRERISVSWRSKEIRLTPNIDIGDLKGSKERLPLPAGRQQGQGFGSLPWPRGHARVAWSDLLHRFAELCSECSTVEKQPKLEGRQMLMFLAPAKDK